MKIALIDKEIQSWFHKDMAISLKGLPEKNEKGIYWIVIYKSFIPVYREDLIGVTEHEAIIRARNMFSLISPVEENSMIRKTPKPPNIDPPEDRLDQGE